MAAPPCPGCLQRDAQLASLQQRVAALADQVTQQAQTIRELQDRLNQNASNSSLPPSANPPQAPPPVRKQPTGRKPGGQPGHPPHLRERLPPERLTQPVVHYRPTTCAVCQHALPAQPAADDPEPRWHQVVELAPVPVEVTEYQAHARTCPDCGQLTWAKIPDDIRAHSCGPRLTATVAYLSAELHASKRAIEAFADTVLQAPLALGTVSNLEQEVSAALAAAHTEAQQAVQVAPAKNVDETGWKQAGRRRWLWGAATARVVCFVITATRGAEGLVTLLGQKVRGVIASDRWSAYGQLLLGQRQLCWAHLQRDFQKLVDRGGPSAEYGTLGLEAVQTLFTAWHRYRGGGRYAEMYLTLDALRQRVRVWLGRGTSCADAKTATFCQNLLDVEPALWTFLTHADVEPTNNHIERLLRKGVLWRKNAFGCHSAAGCLFVERILTVTQTLRLQQRPVLEFLYQSLVAHRSGATAPKLILSR